MIEMLIYVAAGYILSSTILFIFPSLLHKKKEISFSHRFAAHRGGGGERTENTLSAFTTAAQLGADLFELDVQMTKDGVVVVCHDDSLARVCGCEKTISGCNYAELPLCLREIEVACEPGDFYCAAQPEPLLRLEDLYKNFPHVPMQIDVKPGGQELISKVSDLTKKYRRESITIWGAFSHKTTVQCRQYNPRMLTFCSMRECSMYPILILFGVLPWLRIDADFYQVPIPIISCKSGFLSEMNKTVIKLINPLMCNRLLLWHLNRRGIKTGAWVMNHSHEFRTADDYGFDCIMTDYPSRFVEYELDRKKNVGQM